MNRLFALAVLSGLAPALVGCQQSWVKASEGRTIRFFRDLTYGEDFSRKITYDRLRKWTAPLKVGIFGSTPAERKETETQLQSVSELTGLSSKIVDNRLDANLAFFFLPNRSSRNQGEPISCYAHVDASNGTVSSVRITIGTLNPDRTVRCVSRTLMHAMGFPKPSGVLPSVTSPLHREDRFTEWDRFALKVLYDNRLRHGMTEKEASPIYREIIHGMRRTRP